MLSSHPYENLSILKLVVLHLKSVKFKTHQRTAHSDLNEECERVPQTRPSVIQETELLTLLLIVLFCAIS